MKPVFHLPRLCCAVVLAGMLGACGQKGPLYLPSPPPAAAEPAPPVPPSPITPPYNTTPSPVIPQ